MTSKNEESLYLINMREINTCKWFFCLSLVFSRTAFVLFCMFHIMLSLFPSLYLYRHVRVLPLLVTVCGLTLGFPTQTPSAFGTPASLPLPLFHIPLEASTQRQAMSHNDQQICRAHSALHALWLPFFPLQMVPGISRWTSPSGVQFPPRWAALFPSPAQYLSPPRLPPLPPPQLPPLWHLGSSGLWCPAEWRRRSWWRGMKGWRWTRRTKTAPG